MKVLLVNKFLFPKGGDAICTLATGELLKTRGHESIFWGMDHPLNPGYPYANLFVDNLDLNNSGGVKKQYDITLKLLYSFEAKKKIEELIKNVGNPDIVHLHNFAHQISPSVLHVFKRYKIPVVMTMHDYKLTCASYTLMDHGHICETCKAGKYYQCFLKGCVKNSKTKSLINTIEMYLHHKILHIYNLVDIFISPSRFLKAKSEEMGFKGKIVYLPNFVNLEDYVPQYGPTEYSVVYFGRLSKEKGLFTLIEAMRGLDLKLKIIGEGPLKDNLELKITSDNLENVILLGYKTGEELKNAVRKSIAVIVPSEWYENNPRSVIEAFALGKPVLGAKIGGVPELVRDNETGLTFEPGNIKDLRLKILSVLADQNKVVSMGKNARVAVESEFNKEKHYNKLMDIYNTAITEYA